MAETNIKDVKLKIGTDEQFQSKLKDLPLNTLVGITDPIQEGELDSSIIDKLGKADSSLQKPTSTLAKESFVKVGIDGTQNFDENSYVISPSTDGTAGQVLKKTATGTEWANESGGKYYMHDVIISDNSTPSSQPSVFFKYISKDNTKFSLDKLNFKICFDVTTSTSELPPKHYKVNSMVVEKGTNNLNIDYYPTYPYSDTEQTTITILTANIQISDNVVEL